MKLRSHINKDGSIPLSINQRAHLAKRKGKSVFIEIDERSTAEKIGFIEGAITPYFYFQHKRGVFRHYGDARYALKKMFNLNTYIDAEGKRDQVPDSMSKVYASNRKTAEFIDHCEHYFQENGYIFPNPEDYKQWMMTDPGPDEVYPLLRKLIEIYKNGTHNTG